MAKPTKAQIKKERDPEKLKKVLEGKGYKDGKIPKGKEAHPNYKLQIKEWSSFVRTEQLMHMRLLENDSEQENANNKGHSRWFSQAA